MSSDSLEPASKSPGDAPITGLPLFPFHVFLAPGKGLELTPSLPGHLSPLRAAGEAGFGGAQETPPIPAQCAFLTSSASINTGGITDLFDIRWIEFMVFIHSWE